MGEAACRLLSDSDPRAGRAPFLVLPGVRGNYLVPFLLFFRFRKAKFMRSVFSPALFLLSSLFILAQCSAADRKLSYEEMVEKVKAGDESIDFRELRLAYMDSESRRKAKDTDVQKRAMNQALRDLDYAEVLKNAEQVLQQNFVDLEAHHAEFLAYRELHQAAAAHRQNLIVGGLLDSIMKSGDGDSPETAMQVISIDEEYFVLGIVGLRTVTQTLLQKNCHSYDVMDTVDSLSKKKVTIYFDVDVPYSHYLPRLKRRPLCGNEKPASQ